MSFWTSLRDTFTSPVTNSVNAVTDAAHGHFGSALKDTGKAFTGPITGTYNTVQNGLQDYGSLAGRASNGLQGIMPNWMPTWAKHQLGGGLMGLFAPPSMTEYYALRDKGASKASARQSVEGNLGRGAAVVAAIYGGEGLYGDYGAGAAGTGSGSGSGFLSSLLSGAGKGALLGGAEGGGLSALSGQNHNTILHNTLLGAGIGGVSGGIGSGINNLAGGGIMGNVLGHAGGSLSGSALSGIFSAHPASVVSTTPVNQASIPYYLNPDLYNNPYLGNARG